MTTFNPLSYATLIAVFLPALPRVSAAGSAGLVASYAALGIGVALGYGLGAAHLRVWLSREETVLLIQRGSGTTLLVVAAALGFGSG